MKQARLNGLIRVQASFSKVEDAVRALNIDVGSMDQLKVVLTDAGPVYVELELAKWKEAMKDLEKIAGGCQEGESWKENVGDDLHGAVKAAKKTLLLLDPSQLNVLIGKMKAAKKDLASMKATVRFEGADDSELTIAHDALLLKAKVTFVEAKIMDQLMSKANNSNKDLMKTGVAAALKERDSILPELIDQEKLLKCMIEKANTFKDSCFVCFG